MPKKHRSTLIAILIVFIFSTTLSVFPAYAATTITVNTTTDELNADGDCSLREAIETVNTGAQVDNCTDPTVGGAPYTITLPAGTYTLTTGAQLLTTADMTINGAGAGTTIIQASTCNPVTLPGGCTPATNRVLYNNGGALTINELTIANGYPGGYGGGIYNDGDLTITNSAVSDNFSTTGDGGGIYNDGDLTITNSAVSDNSIFYYDGGGISNSSSGIINTITNSTFSGNSGTNNGGGIYNRGTINTIANSAFSGNSANFGGGIFNYGTLAVANSTFSGNSATINGGGIDNADTLWVTNSTFSGNSATINGGGIYNDSGTLHLKNTISANSISGGDCYNFSGTISTNINNLIENNAAGANACGTPAYTSDPLLAALANNGGPTDTFFPAWNSDVVDNGDDPTCAASVGSPSYGAGGHDQRGVTRPAVGCDIGAVERDPLIPIVVSTSLAASYTGTGPSVFTVTFNVNVSNLGGGTGPDDVENPANYLLVEEGPLAGFQTTACNNTDLANDTQITVNSVTYDQNTYTSTVNINGGTALPLGSYRLFVCGTTSIIDPANIPLYAGDFDYIFSFVVRTVAVLPDTGFAPNRVTFLPQQPAVKAYAEYGDLWMEIPRLGVKMSIVGVPVVGEEWDVSWLGDNAGYLEGTAFPTYAGNTGITAHIWDANNNPGPFVNLRKLQHGDVVKIHAWGYVYSYSVRYNYKVFSDNMNIFHHEELDWVTLLTCEQYSEANDSYRFRRVVRAVLVDVSSE